jgi:D-lactate dehydrogenase
LLIADMRTAVYSTKDYERHDLAAAALRHALPFSYVAEALGPDTVGLSNGCEMISVFAGDDVSAPVLEALNNNGVKYVAVRAAGYDNVDLHTAHRLGMRVANVPEYSPYAIAEHAVGMMMALNRKLITADRQVHSWNFRVGNLIGFDLHEKTVGIIGTGRIGRIVARILHGFGCRLLGHDLKVDPALQDQYGMVYTDLESLCRQSDIITINTCLTQETRHLISGPLIEAMKPGVLLINTSRGAVVDTAAIITGLESGRIGYFGADVYEYEKGVFFYDRSASIPDDPMLHRLLAMPNVLITPHQAYATREALNNIAETTCHNLSCWTNNKSPEHEL